MFCISLHLKKSSAQCWYQKGKLCKNYWSNSYPSLFIYHLFPASAAAQKPLVYSLSCMGKGFIAKENNGSNAVLKALLLPHFTVWKAWRLCNLQPASVNLLLENGPELGHLLEELALYLYR